MDPVIQTQSLTKYYGRHRVVDSLNLSVPKGCVYGFLGRNGAGKSTTIKMLVGLVKPDRGSSMVLGEGSLALSPETKARLAFMPEGHPAYTGMKVREAVRFHGSFFPMWDRDRVEQLLDYFKIPLGKRLGKLSRGQKAQTALALAVGSDPELLILDDPTLGLDTVVRREFLESLIEIIQRRERTILFSSHILGDVERVADRIGILVDGTLRVDCPTDQFKQALKKVIIEFAGEPPEIGDCRGLVSSRRGRNRVELVIANYNGDHRERFESLSPVRLEEVEFNLEDAFIEYTRGEERSLPSLGGEDRHE